MTSTELRELFPPELEARMKKAGCWPNNDGRELICSAVEHGLWWYRGEGGYAGTFNAANALRVACEDWLIDHKNYQIAYGSLKDMHSLCLDGGMIPLFVSRHSRIACLAAAMNTELPKGDA